MEMERERSRKLFKNTFIKSLVLLFCLIGAAIASFFAYLLLNYHEALQFVTADLIQIGSTSLIVSGVLIASITLLAFLFLVAEFLCKYKNSDTNLVLTFTAIVCFAVAGSATTMAVLSSQVVSEVEDNGGNAILRYRLDTNASNFSSEANSAVDFLETNLVCCGFNNASDWLLLNIDAVTNGSPPPSCPSCDLIDPDDCVTFTHEKIDEIFISFNTTRLGCTAVLEKRVDVLKKITIAMAATFGAAMVFLLLLLVLRVIRKRRED